MDPGQQHTASDVPRRDLDREIVLALRGLLQHAPEVQSSLATRLGIGSTDVAALDHLVSSPASLGVVELGRLLGIRSASATVLVDRLVRAGHLERIKHATDARRVALRPTGSARGEVREVLTPLIDAIGDLAAELDEGSARAVLRFLVGAADAMRAFAAESGDAS